MDGHAPSFRTKLVSELLRRVPANVRGRTRLARAALGSGLRARNVQLATRDGDFVVPNLDGPTAFHLLVDGVYESEEIDLVLSRLPRGGTFADVGANIGVYSVPAAKKVGPDGRVLLFEASPRIQEYLAHNLELNRVKNATVLKFAVGDVDGGSVAFYDSPSENFGMGTLTNLFGTEPIHVPLFSLDYLLADAGVAHIDVMKVDVEGHEAGVFRGAAKLLTGRAPPLIVFEFNDWSEEKAHGVTVGDAQRVLRDYGYALHTLSGYLDGAKPLGEILTTGCHSLVATPPSSASA